MALQHTCLSRVEGLNSATTESEESSDSKQVNFNLLGLTGAEICALKSQKIKAKVSKCLSAISLRLSDIHLP